MATVEAAVDPALSPLRLAGFLLASWAVIGNDSLQVLGPFLQVNRDRTPRWLQALVLSALLAAVLLLGWWRSGGDASWGRLAAYPEPSQPCWTDLLPPLAVLLLTQAGVPLSTTFLVLMAFTPANLPRLLHRSLLGYGLALLVGLLVYGVGAVVLRFRAEAATATATVIPTPTATATPTASATATVTATSTATATATATVTATALVLQWLVSGWLWSQWLIQDLANIFIYLPRRLSGGAMALALAVLCLGVCLLLLERGGPIQAILRRKSGLDSPLAGVQLSLIYGGLLALLGLWSPEPLSTTWVFLGLLAGRELGRLCGPKPRQLSLVALDLGRDLALAALGLAVSLALALGLQPLRGLA